MVRLLGHYRRHVRPGGGGADAIHPDFDEAAFLSDAPGEAPSFLRLMRGSQHFEVWLGEHVPMQV